ncbi:MAG: zinc-ribbon domain-containing protein, partial [Thaumarchaeota archaeon]|nr:zinc-ribbon domain-containing protein [Nitrososphaerota archaeon]
GAKFCMNCGTPLRSVMKCPKCGADVPSGAKFCPKCGTKLV